MNLRFHHLLLTALFCVVANLSSAADDILICHPDSPGVLSKGEEKAVLLGTKINWANGQVIRLAVLAGGTAHGTVINEFTARSTEQFDKYWERQTFTGKGIAPTVCASNAAMLAFVAMPPGAFGYAGGTAKTAGVKVVAVK